MSSAQLLMLHMHVCPVCIDHPNRSLMASDVVKRMHHTQTQTLKVTRVPKNAGCKLGEHLRKQVLASYLNKSDMFCHFKVILY